MNADRLEVNVTFDVERGYVGSAPELLHSVTALSLGGLRRRIEIAMLPDNVHIVLQLDGLAERERHRRRGAGAADQYRYNAGCNDIGVLYFVTATEWRSRWAARQLARLR
jgi:hypothetical protein